MGHKVVCLNCRKAFSIGTDFTAHVPSKCPECDNTLELFNQRFRPPKKAEVKAWKVIAYLFQNGFYFQHVKAKGDEMTNKEGYINYPSTMKEAVEFVKKYKAK